MKKTTNLVWGGRFEYDSSDILKRINNSISFDYNLAHQDIKLNKQYAKSLFKAKILSVDELKKINVALDDIQQEVKKKKFKFSDDFEDIHMNIEMALRKRVGRLAGKLHTGKSRNDQVVTDVKLWTKEKIKNVIDKIKKIQKTIIKKSESNLNVIMPGFTHSQNAQPILYAHYLLSFFEMFERDKKRAKQLLENIDECPLGSGALAGTNFYEIDRKALAKNLGFKKPTENSLDSVSDRDFVIEFLCLLSILSMPQKKNPDAAELVRSKCGRIYSSLLNLLIIQKGLPSGYSKDLQEDKEPLFDAFRTIDLLLDIVNEMIDSVTINKIKMYDLSKKGYMTATDLADWIVKKTNYTFREAHNITGKIVLIAEKKKKELSELTLQEFKLVEPKISKDIFNYVSLENSVSSKNSYGGTNINQVLKAIKRAKKKI